MYILHMISNLKGKTNKKNIDIYISLLRKLDIRLTNSLLWFECKKHQHYFFGTYSQSTTGFIKKKNSAQKTFTVIWHAHLKAQKRPHLNQSHWLITQFIAASGTSRLLARRPWIGLGASSPRPCVGSLWCSAPTSSHSPGICMFAKLAKSALSVGVSDES